VRQKQTGQTEFSEALQAHRLQRFTVDAISDDKIDLPWMIRRGCHS
jgi:hypothetical protein